MSPEKLVRECADKLGKIFGEVEVEGSTIYYRSHLLVSRGWILGGDNIPPEPALFVETINEGKIIVSLDGEFENSDAHLLTYAIASIVAWEVIGRKGDATIFSDDSRVRIEVGNFKQSWIALEISYACPYKVEVRLYKEGGSKVETVGEFAPTNFETLRKIVALYLL
jgi:hypothetical protein